MASNPQHMGLVHPGETIELLRWLDHARYAVVRGEFVRWAGGSGMSVKVTGWERSTTSTGNW